ncbi:LON peptidase substrate-binding domain-containing protein [Hoeflea sp. YIM 152468]|uniref:LON peptidase substrate-binding domain-containing protein n=1 Tax=Hoeflea sp. YIM 152468 TaxID=3031759 RepID=UPI0023DB98BC|nr:LON peptidase substrate-binding domain-containing protein [Hoeflea sp. YIM 152468]MDF1608242.1 LON peptidase substrate-binding domain-containing protein [Hoeflea sp. YIM 152468]
MQVGNKSYRVETDVPDQVPVFPLSGALLLPGAQLPLNVFEPRYLSMFDEAMASDRLIGVIQPALAEAESLRGPVEDLCRVGCLGRITSFAETGDGRYVVALGGVCRFRLTGELDSGGKPYRICRIAPFFGDLEASDDSAGVDRDALLQSFKAYLDANDLEADWNSVERASTESLVNSLSMMSPYGPAEKQALLEADNLKLRAETLIAITEIALARDSDDYGRVLQ